MDINDLQTLFNRAIDYTFEKRKLLLVSIILILCGVLVIFFRALALYAEEWVMMSLTFLPFFLCGGILLATGVLLTRVYHDEIKKKPVSYRLVLAKSWEIILGASYFFVPIILCYLLMWILLGAFFLLRHTPSTGEFFGIIFSFAPFLLNFGSLLLAVSSIGLLFFVTPTVALKSVDPISVSQVIVKRIRRNVFINSILLLIATTPLALLLTLLIFAAIFTGASSYIEVVNPLGIVLQWFFIMIPFAMLLSPMIIFFFNFSTESHIYMRRRDKIS